MPVISLFTVKPLLLRADERLAIPVKWAGEPPICYMEPKRLKSSAIGSRRQGPAEHPAKGMALWKKDRRPTEIYWRPRDCNVIPGQGGRETMTLGYYFCFMEPFSWFLINSPTAVTSC